MIPPPQLPLRPLPPEHRATARFPKNPHDLIGWTASKLAHELGEPDKLYAGQYWHVSDGLGGKQYARQPDGNIVQQAWFGPRAPHGLAPGEPYTVWHAANVNRSVWMICLRDLNGEPVIFDVIVYPADAIF